MCPNNQYHIVLQSECYLNKSTQILYHSTSYVSGFFNYVSYCWSYVLGLYKIIICKPTDRECVLTIDCMYSYTVYGYITWREQRKTLQLSTRRLSILLRHVLNLLQQTAIKQLRYPIWASATSPGSLAQVSCAATSGPELTGDDGADMTICSPTSFSFSDSDTVCKALNSPPPISLFQEVSVVSSNVL